MISSKKNFIALSIIVIIIAVALRFYIYNKSIVGYPIGLDGEYQFYQLKKHISEKKFPIEGVFLNSPDTYDSEENSRVPGGYFYLSYMLKYFIGGSSYELERGITGAERTRRPG